MDAPNPAMDRLRFAQFALDRLPNGRCRVHVELTWRDGAAYRGECEGLGSEAGELRCAAQACVNALTQAVAGANAVKFDLLGVKSVRAFDATVVIVALTANGDAPDAHGQRIIGSYLTDTDAARGAALAVLNATNRILGNRLFMR